MNRHRLTKRVADNVKHSRTLVNEGSLNNYFPNMYHRHKKAQGLNLACIFFRMN